MIAAVEIIPFGASAIADGRNVIPAAIERIGGTVEHFGMSVDPGNLMLLGRVKGRPVLGAPDRGSLIVVPVTDGRRGDPVLWSRRFFLELIPSTVASAPGV